VEGHSLRDHRLQFIVAHLSGSLHQCHQLLVALYKLAFPHLRNDLLAGMLCALLGGAEHQCTTVLTVHANGLEQLEVEHPFKGEGVTRTSEP
jgi:hypothetical protein